MFKIKWDKKIEITNQLLFMLIISWLMCGFGLGLIIGFSL